jgi:BASS family bile acid:Na+ symporter
LPDIALEVGMQNAGLASDLHWRWGSWQQRFSAGYFGPVMNITGSTLASWWHNHLPKDVASTASTETKETVKQFIIIINLPIHVKI